MTTQQILLSGWTWNPVILLCSAAALAAYLSTFRFNARFWYFAAALIITDITLLSPLNLLADGYLFSAHMLQHLLLLLIVPALFLLSLPHALALPKFFRSFTYPLLGWVAGVGSMWLWHAPTLCNAAVSSKPIYALQTVSLLVLGMVFWWQILAPRDEQRLSPPGAVVYLFTACTACTILGIILTFSPVTVCSIYMHSTDRLGLLNTIRGSWGITPERDQEIGGLLMWVPMCMIYLIAIFGQLARWFSEPAPHLASVKEKI